MSKKTQKKTTTYQVGVDVLGFPIYVEHTTFCETHKSFIKQKKVLKVRQLIIKQH
jgi:hypothetical protein